MRKKLLVAVGLAALATLSLWLYSRSLEKTVAGGAKVSVLVAAVDIAPGARLKRTDLAIREVPEAYMHQASIRKGEENQVLGRPVADKIPQGQQLLWSDFELQRSQASRRLSAAIQKGQRAVTIPVDLSGSLAGMLRPGDHVDILGTFARAQGADWATVTLLQRVLVLATGDVRGGSDSEVDQAAQGGRAFTSITVAVDLEEAELLVFAMQRGPVNVALRAQDDIESIEDVPDKTFSDIFEVQRRSAFARRHAKKIEALKPTP